MSFSSAHGGKYGTLLYGLIRICWLNSIVQEVYLHQVYLLTTSCAYTCIPFFYIILRKYDGIQISYAMEPACTGSTFIQF
ncbi:Uncharacterised protein [Escherichia coli]|uniref:Uncharacterized protein n=1 Tax=Escherichia coli TaxID=562 RepID=A0A376L2M0_ECOLX|nr:Uncharacterised protein [Escherichia coli]